ncbi:MAG TPA: glycosyltransferase family 39 protein [Solirubrobacteraceae bacterium]|jgi:4-amino-4-deoxy-L-arabinose transferase-like glycosyltransferase
MSSLGQAADAPSAPPAQGEARHPLGGLGGRGTRLLASIPLARTAGFVAVVALSAVLNTNRLAQNGYGNVFYAAGVRSMLRSLHNFFFVSFDPGGLISIDKPPLALWLQAASAKLFGFTPLSLLLPEAIMGILAVAALYLILARRLGTLAAFAGGLGLAVFPSFVAVSRENGVDALLILLLVLACGAALRACESGHWRSLLASAALVGLAFNTKTLAAYLVVPGIAAGYAVCAPGSVRRRAVQLALAGVLTAAVSFAWIAAVEATPASKRPYVGSSTNNTEIGLAIEYNGVGRVEGQSGGPHTTVVKPGARVPLKHHASTHRPSSAGSKIASGVSSHAKAANGRDINPIPFGGPPGPLRLFGVGLGDQAAWLLPFALFGLLGVALLGLLERRPARDSEDEHAPARAPGRRDPRLATALVLGGWFLVEAVVLSASKGIVHPYYVSALGPGTGAMAGAGAVAFLRLARGPHRLWALALVGLAVTATVAAQSVLAHREHYMLWFVPVLVIGAVVLLGALVALRALALPAISLLFVLLLVLPTAYSATTWLAPVEGTFPAAGPTQAAGSTNGYGVNERDLAIDKALLSYVAGHRPGTRWELLTVASDTAAPMMLMGLNAGALGGYSGTDQAVTGEQLGRYVARGEARWVLLGGEYSTRGGNLATKAVLRACRQVAPSVWKSPVGYPFGLTLFDCAGRQRQLAA